MNSILKDSFKQQFKRKPHIGDHIGDGCEKKKNQIHHQVSLCSLEHFTVETTIKTSSKVL